MKNRKRKRREKTIIWKRKRKREKKKKAIKDNILSMLSNAFSFRKIITVEFQKQSEIS